MFLVLLNWNKSASEIQLNDLLAIRYVLNTYCNTESPYRDMVLLGDTHP